MRAGERAFHRSFRLPVLYPRRAQPSTLLSTLNMYQPVNAPLPRFTGLLGSITFLALAYAFHQPPRHPLAPPFGPRQDHLRCPRHQMDLRADHLATVSGVITGLLGHLADGSSSPSASRRSQIRLSVFAFAVLPTIIFLLSAFLRHPPPHRPPRAADHQGRRLDHAAHQCAPAEPKSTNVAASTSSWVRPKPFTIRAHSSPELDLQLRAHDHGDLRHGPRLRRNHGRVYLV